jgi:uncharacterized protein
MEIQLEQNANHSIASVIDDSHIKLENGDIKEIPCYINNLQIKTDLKFSFDTMIYDDLIAVLDKDTTILIIGLNKPAFLDEKLRLKLQQKSIAVEVMNTNSACHAFNVLLSELRMVGLLLL